MTAEAPMPTNVVQEPLTILRIKRKRTDEPVEALVIQPESKRATKEHVGKGENIELSTDTLDILLQPRIFRLAETLSKSEFESEDGSTRKKLRDRLQTLQDNGREGMGLGPKFTQYRQQQQQQQQQRIEEVESEIPSNNKEESTGSVVIGEKKDKLVKEMLNKAKESRFKVIRNNRRMEIVSGLPASSEEELDTRKGGVLNKDVEELFAIYDVVREEMAATERSKTKRAPVANEGDLLCNNLPMERLQISDETTMAKGKPIMSRATSQFYQPPQVPVSTKFPSAASKDETAVRVPSQEGDGDLEEDYVYDIYTLTDPVSIGVAPSSIATVVWEDEGEDKFLNNSDSDSFVAEDDEDSNAEDWYMNEYPDEFDRYESSDDGFAVGTSEEENEETYRQRRWEGKYVEDDAYNRGAYGDEMMNALRRLKEWDDNQGSGSGERKVRFADEEGNGMESDEDNGVYGYGQDSDMEETFDDGEASEDY